MEEKGSNPEGGGHWQLRGHMHEHASKFGMMMCLAKEAKMELLKEKMKKRIDSADGRKLDEIADIISQLLMEKGRMKMGFAKKKHELKSRLEEVLMEE